jgi:hypothetical protein
VDRASCRRFYLDLPLERGDGRFLLESDWLSKSGQTVIRKSRCRFLFEFLESIHVAEHRSRVAVELVQDLPDGHFAQLRKKGRE